MIYIHLVQMFMLHAYRTYTKVHFVLWKIQSYILLVGTNIYEHGSITCNYNWKRAETTWFHNWRSNQIKLVVKKKINLWTEPQWSLLLLLLVIVKGRRSNNCLGVDDSHITFVLGVSYFTGHYNMRWGLANW
jgi:hypothetical protein